jgi:hypothetical protein
MQFYSILNIISRPNSQRKENGLNCAALPANSTFPCGKQRTRRRVNHRINGFFQRTARIAAVFSQTSSFFFINMLLPHTPDCTLLENENRILYYVTAARG